MVGEDDPEREQYHFTHPIIHEVFYHAMLVTRRRQWHRRIGEAIEATQPRMTRRLRPPRVPFRAGARRRAGRALSDARGGRGDAHLRPGNGD